MKKAINMAQSRENSEEITRHDLDPNPNPCAGIPKQHEVVGLLGNLQDSLRKDSTHT